jgi:hypothetical protein
MMRSRLRDRGSTLILVVGVLGLMVLLVAAFAAVVTMEARAAANQRDSEQARLIAMAGLERGKYEIRRSLTVPGFPAVWLQYDGWDCVQKDFNASFAPSDIRHTTCPSLGFAWDSTKNPAQSPPTSMTFGGAGLPWPSGFMGSTYYRSLDAAHPFMGDYYVLRIVDCNSQIFLNDANPHLGTMIDSLVEGIGDVGDGQPTPTSFFTTSKSVGDKLITGRPSGGYRRLSEVHGVLLTAFPGTDSASGMIDGDRMFYGLQPYITTRAWVDAKVIQCGNQQVGSGSYVAPTLALQPRAPINMNLAPKPVLYAVFKGISCNSGADKILRPAAQDLASAVLTYRKNPTMAPYSAVAGNPATRRFGIGSWAEFQAFLATKTGLTPNQQLAVLANCNPNTDLNKLVPDLSIQHDIDKTDLYDATTELSFSPGGIFSIEALGLVLGPDGNSVVAEAQARTVVKAFDRVVDTTQADFETSRLDTGDAGHPALRDMTTFPEYRNNGAAVLTGTKAVEGNLLAADWDGQLCFNALSACTPSSDNAIAGYIDNTLNADHVGTPATATGGVRTDGTNPGTVPGTNPALSLARSMCGDPGAASPWLTGSDLSPLGVLVGRQGRHLGYSQADMIGTSGQEYTHFGPVQLNEHVKVSLSTDFNYTKTTYSYTQHYTTNDHSVLDSDKWSDPVVTNTQNNTGSALGDGGGKFPLPAGESGNLDTDINGLIYPWSFYRIEREGFSFWFKPPKGKGAQVLFDWHSGPPASPNALFTINSTVAANPLPATWGGQTTLHMWLTADGSDGYDVHCKIHVDQKTGDDSGMSGSYDHEWRSEKIMHGTWHHCHFTVYTQVKSKRGGTHFYLDGKDSSTTHVTDVTGSEPGWPTEWDTQERLISEAVALEAAYYQNAVNTEFNHLNTILAEQEANAQAQSSRTNQTFNGAGGADGNNASQEEDVDKRANLVHDVGEQINASGTPVSMPSLPSPSYTPTHRVPVYIPLGTTGWHGCKDAACSTFPDSAGDFLGIIDNVLYDNRRTDPLDSESVDGGGYIERYDNYRPSTGNTTTTGPVVFRKHVPSLEWDKPVRILTEAMTAWKSVKNGGSVDLDVGKVDLRLGWIPTPSTSTVTVPQINDNYAGTETQGWTKACSQQAYCSLLNSYLVPSRTGNLGGFLTKGTSEWYLYAIELSPTTDDQGGPRMTPVIDDVTITYMPWDCLTVLEEEMLD